VLLGKVVGIDDGKTDGVVLGSFETDGNWETLGFWVGIIVG